MDRRGLLKKGATAISASVLARSTPSSANFLAKPPLAAAGDTLSLEIEFRRDGSGGLRGHETVRYLRRADNRIEVTALSLSDDPAVTRFAWYLLREDWRPAECAVTVTADGRFAGSGRYLVDGSRVMMTGTDPTGRGVSEDLTLTEEVNAIVSHTVSSDVMTVLAATTGEERSHGVFLTSEDPYGRRAPEWVRADAHIRQLGRDTLDTPAGPISADHFLLSLPDATSRYAPFQDLWCLADTPIFLAAHARAPTSTWYTLRSIASA